MNSKKVNWIFLSIILLHFVLVALVTALGFKYAYTLDIVLNFILSQGILLVPALLGVFFSGENLIRLAGLRRIKLSSVFKICLFTFLSMPLTTLINMISMLFVDNTVAAISGEVLEAPFLIMLFIIGIFGPFSEELVFRGIVYQGYRKSGTAFQAMVLSALLFALMHMNFNQAAYAFVIGLMLALLVEATGSLWSSVVFHMFFNSQQVCVMYLYDAVSLGGNGLEEAQEMLTRDMLLLMISIWLIIAAAATALAACVLVWIAKGEGRENALQAVWRGRKRRGNAQQAKENWIAANGLTGNSAPESGLMGNRMAENRATESRIEENRVAESWMAENRAAESRIEENRVAENWMAENRMTGAVQAYLPDDTGKMGTEKESAKPDRLVTVPLVAGIALALSYMTLEIVLERMFF